MSNMTEKEIEKLADEHAKQFHGDYDNNCTEDAAYNGFIEGYKAALQNKVSDIGAEEESEFELLLKVKNELLKADKLPFAERVEANKGILNFVSIKRKPIVNERKDNVGVFSIEDIKSAIAFGYNTGYYDGRDKTDYKRPDNGENFEEFIQSLPTQQKDESQSQNNIGVSDAVAFKDWCDKNTWEHEMRDETHYTTKELYKIFQESQPKKESQ